MRYPALGAPKVVITSLRLALKATIIQNENWISIGNVEITRSRNLNDTGLEQRFSEDYSVILEALTNAGLSGYSKLIHF